MVAAGSTTPFTANVRHKFEHADLVVPVTAALASGGVSVSPSGTQVRAPATFRYVAPDTDGQTATVNLETHSKRGIATLAATFRTGPSSYAVDTTSFDIYHLTGTICDLTKPFKLSASAPTILATGTFTFKPSGAAAGAWSYKGNMGQVLAYQAAARTPSSRHPAPRVACPSCG
jgi:hypothetical protein